MWGTEQDAKRNCTMVAKQAPYNKERKYLSAKLCASLKGLMGAQMRVVQGRSKAKEEVPGEESYRMVPKPRWGPIYSSVAT